MQLEAVGTPLRYRLRTGQEIFLKPGVPVELPDTSARWLLNKAGHRVRVVRRDWLREWRDLAEQTSGLTAEDPRVKPVLAALDVCDAAFMADEWEAFEQARNGVLRAMEGASAEGRR